MCCSLEIKLRRIIIVAKNFLGWEMQLKILGINYKTAPVEVREKFSVDKESVRRGLENLECYDGLEEAVILSTCNRTEIYAVISTIHADNVRNFLNDLTGGNLENYLYEYTGESCVRHLFKVAASLDSLILGEGQILSQVKDAYTLAKSAGATGTVLNTLFNKAIAVGKVVRTETRIAYNSVSVSSAAVNLAEKILGDLKNCKALIFGAGKMAQLTAQHLRAHNISKIFVANRHYSRAVEMAEKFSAQAVTWDAALNNADEVDIIITSTGAPHYVVKTWETQQLMARRKGRELLFIDIAVPRDVDPEVAKINGVTLYNIDDLESVVEENIKFRQEEAKSARKIVEEHVAAIMERFKYLKFRPLMADLSQRAEKIRQREVKRISNKLPNLSEDERKIIEQMTKKIVRKLLRMPMMRLNASVGTDDEKFFADAMKALLLDG